ncbi:hypothetical protein [Massilia sp.]|nr:hypothetical protein [Massilia sp.]
MGPRLRGDDVLEEWSDARAHGTQAGNAEHAMLDYWNERCNERPFSTEE